MDKGLPYRTLPTDTHDDHHTSQPSQDFHYRPFLNRDRLVHIIDGDLHTCDTLSVLFRLEGFKTAFCAEPLSYIEAVGRLAPDVVVIGTEPFQDIASVVSDIRSANRSCLVVCLFADGNVNAAADAMKAGAVNVMSKPVDNERLVRSVLSELRKDVQLGTSPLGQRTIQIRGFSSLTGRERQVLELIASGLSNKQAAQRLEISPRTVEVHRAKVMTKMGARNTADLLRIVLTN